MTELAKIETVMPSWRFMMSDEMGIEADRFYKWVDYMPRVGAPADMRKFAKSFANGLSSDFPLIYKADQKLGGCITEAVLHLGEGNHDTYLPGYLWLFGQMMQHARKTGDPNSIRSACEKFINYTGAPLNEGAGLSKAEKFGKSEAEIYNAKLRAVAEMRKKRAPYLSVNQFVDSA